MHDKCEWRSYGEGQKQLILFFVYIIYGILDFIYIIAIFAEKKEVFMELNVNVSVKKGKINAVPRLSTWNNGDEPFNSELAKKEL